MFNPDIVSRFDSLETPFYYYDLNLLQQTVDACRTAADVHGFHVHYAMKANFNEKVIERIRKSGIGADCVSLGEVKAAIEQGFAPGKVVFAGVGKSDKEISEAISLDIFCFNVESLQELDVIDELAAKQGKKARVAIRINPNVDAHTHHNITTGLEENKFGINAWELPAVTEKLRACKNLEFTGIHFHIGSLITDMNVFKSLCIKVNELSHWFAERGFSIKVLNVGGGLGVDYYQPDENPVADFAGYFRVFADFLDRKPGQEVHFELGRALTASCGSLISRVLYVKNGIKKNFLVLDAGMTELMRPALYQAFHKIENLSKLTTHHSALPTKNYDVVGPICESTDRFGVEVPLPESFRNDLIAIRTAGAYGEVMASRYNLRDEIRHYFIGEEANP